MKTELIRSQLTDAQKFVDEACAKAKMWKKALALLEEMEVKGIAPTDVTYRLDTFSTSRNTASFDRAFDLNSFFGLNIVLQSRLVEMADNGRRLWIFWNW